MGSHHHHHSHHHGNNLCHQTRSNSYCSSSCCYSCNCNCNCSCSSSSPRPHPPPPPPISTDQLLQSMATNFFKTQSFLKPQQVFSQSLFQDLIRRVSALESSLSQLSSQTSPPLSAQPSPPLSAQPSPLFRRPTSPPSLRQVAARTIQARFRRFLVRRSQALRGLKRLASIKSSVAALRSLLSRDTDAEPEAITHEAMDLLLQLDSIQSSDPMIRDGKRSISRELTRMLEFIDKVLVRERRAMEVVEDATGPVSRTTRSAKRVSFADNRRGIEEDVKDRFSMALEEKGEGSGNGNGSFDGQNGDFELSAPQPLQMELRLGL